MGWGGVGGGAAVTTAKYRYFIIHVVYIYIYFLVYMCKQNAVVEIVITGYLLPTVSQILKCDFNIIKITYMIFTYT